MIVKMFIFEVTVVLYFKAHTHWQSYSAKKFIISKANKYVVHELRKL